MSNSSIRPKDRTLSSATTSEVSGPGSDDNEAVLRISQSSSIMGASTSDSLMSYQEYSLGGGLTPSTVMQSVYSTTLAGWAGPCVK